jgi:hypothetical protein
MVGIGMPEVIVMVIILLLILFYLKGRGRLV